MDIFKESRINMVKGQIVPQNVTNDKLIKYITEIPRHIFLPDNKYSVAYVDSNILINSCRYMLSAVNLAKILDCINIKESDVVLDVACGTGYSTSIIASMCKNVTAIESNSELASRARLNFNKLNLQNVILIEGGVQEMEVDETHYNYIIINKAVKDVSDSLLNILKPNGVLVAPVHKAASLCNVRLFQKKDGKIFIDDIDEINLPIIEEI